MLAYDVNGQVVIALVRVADKMDKDEILMGHLETWAFDAGKNTWTKLDPPKTPGGFHNRRRIMAAVPDQNLILMENYVNDSDRLPDAAREQQIWTYRYQAMKPAPKVLPPTDLKVTTTKTSLTLTWKPSLSKKATTCTVYRGEGMKPWEVELKPFAVIGTAAASFTDERAKPGVVYTYAVRRRNRQQGDERFQREGARPSRRLSKTASSRC